MGMPESVFFAGAVVAAAVAFAVAGFKGRRPNVLVTRDRGDWA